MTRVSRTGLLQFIGPCGGKTYRDVEELHIRKVLPPPEAYRSGLKALETENRRILKEKGYAYRIPDDHHRITDRGYSLRTQTCLKEAIRGGDLQRLPNGRYVLTDNGRHRLEERVSSQSE